MKKIIGFFIALVMLSCVYGQSKLPVPVQKLFSQLVYVQGGDFLYQKFYLDNVGEQGQQTKVRDLLVAKYEVNRELYEFVTGEKKERWDFYENKPEDLTKPANGISWYEAVEFCNKLSEISGLKKCYKIDGTNVSFDENADGFRLPTDIEWEYFGTGGAKSKGGAYVGNSNFLDDVANCSGRLAQCGLKKPNELGLYDLAGNVWEWCWDGDEKMRHVRGGSYGTNARASYTNANPVAEATTKADDFGFRVVKNK